MCRPFRFHKRLTSFLRRHVQNYSPPRGTKIKGIKRVSPVGELLVDNIDKSKHGHECTAIHLDTYEVRSSLPSLLGRLEPTPLCNHFGSPAHHQVPNAFSTFIGKVLSVFQLVFRVLPSKGRELPHNILHSRILKSDRRLNEGNWDNYPPPCYEESRALIPEIVKPISRP